MKTCGKLAIAGAVGFGVGFAVKTVITCIEDRIVGRWFDELLAECDSSEDEEEDPAGSDVCPCDDCWTSDDYADEPDYE